MKYGKGATRPQNVKGTGSPPKGMPDLAGINVSGKQANRSKPVNYDAPHYGNVSGCCSKPVNMGRGK
jgi:hypothetical protein